MIGTEQLAFLYRFDFLEASMKDDFSAYDNSTLTVGQHFARIMMFRGVVELVTALLAFLITLNIGKKRQYHWLNALVVLLLCLAVKYTFILDIDAFNSVIQSPGRLFKGYGLLPVILINGSLFLGIALSIFALIWRKYGRVKTGESPPQ